MQAEVIGILGTIGGGLAGAALTAAIAYTRNNDKFKFHAWCAENQEPIRERMDTMETKLHERISNVKDGVAGVKQDVAVIKAKLDNSPVHNGGFDRLMKEVGEIRDRLK